MENEKNIFIQIIIISITVVVQYLQYQELSQKLDRTLLTYVAIEREAVHKSCNLQNDQVSEF